MMGFAGFKAGTSPFEPVAANEPQPPADELGQLIIGLAQLGAWIAAANEKILARLAARESTVAGPADSADSAAHFVGDSADDSAALLRGIQAAIASLSEQVAAATEGIRRLHDHVERGLTSLAERIASSEASIEPVGPTAADWEQAVLGPEIVAQPSLAFQRNHLIQSVLRGDAAACALVGQLLVFRAAPPERLPPLLKEIGEAYYRWQPKTLPGSCLFEEALAASLQRACEAAGIRNTIELVYPGERFDAARHNAATRGVEITEVHGWIVLRDNGKVYTKANVTVR